MSQTFTLLKIKKTILKKTLLKNFTKKRNKIFSLLTLKSIKTRLALLLPQTTEHCIK